MTVQDTLQALGITRSYRGCLRAATAIELVLEDEDRLEAVTKEIYREVAKRCRCIGMRWSETSARRCRGRGASTGPCSLKWRGIHWRLRRPRRNLSPLLQITCAGHRSRRL